MVLETHMKLRVAEPDFFFLEKLLLLQTLGVIVKNVPKIVVFLFEFVKKFGLQFLLKFAASLYIFYIW